MGFVLLLFIYSFAILSPIWATAKSGFLKFGNKICFQIPIRQLYQNNIKAADELIIKEYDFSTPMYLIRIFLRIFIGCKFSKFRLIIL